jgi:hypothetical protein
MADDRLVLGTNETSTFHAMNVDDGEAVELGPGNRAVISPDGSAIALWQSDPFTGHILTQIVQADGGESTSVEGVAMAWSSDGSVLLLGVDNPDGTATFRLVDATGDELATYDAVAALRLRRGLAA